MQLQALNSKLSQENDELRRINYESENKFGSLRADRQDFSKRIEALNHDYDQCKNDLYHANIRNDELTKELTHNLDLKVRLESDLRKVEDEMRRYKDYAEDELARFREQERREMNDL